MQSTPTTTRSGFSTRQTVATGVSGEPTPPGSRSGRRGEQEAAAVVLAQPGRELVQVPHLAERDAELEQAEVVDRQQRVPALDRASRRPVPSTA